MDIREMLKKDRILIADGATGTQLQKLGLPPGYPPELWNVERPDAILAHHRAYIEAGSDIILTNTFGGSYIKLHAYQLESRTAELNMTAAKIAREAAGSDHFVFGDIGPTGELLFPLGSLSEEDAVNAFKTQIRALADGGVDAILIETMSALEEAKSAIQAAQSVCTLPIFVTMSFDTKGRTMMGVKPAVAARELWAMGIQGIGANCGRTLTETLAAIQEMKAAVPDCLLMAKPNAGLPNLDNHQLVYDVTPETMAEFAEKFQTVGVKILGACCGSNPDHIRAMAEKLAK